MSRRTVGVTLISIAAFLYGVRYLSAAIFGSGVSSWNRDLFESMLEYVGHGLSIWAVVALVVGVAYLVWAEVSHRRGL
ncbi:MAG: DNA helicase [Peptococcaceae bacterium BRH_c4a]|nr:MAG: DNA helicase [Peptococcaceae bacterium BRH_c4a]